MMGSPSRIRDAFDAASDFLNPILSRDEIQKAQGQSLLGTLSRISTSVGVDDATTRAAVIGDALDLLIRIHTAFVVPADKPSESDHPLLGSEDAALEDAALEDAKRRRVLHALLDLISLEGIYPSLSSGIGIPLQQRVISVLPAGVIAKKVQAPPSSVPHDEALLRRIMKSLFGIIFDTRQSIQPVIRGRILSDIISGISDLAFNPSLNLSNDRDEYRQAFSKVIDDTPSSVLLPTLTSFLQSETTAWFKFTVSSQIAEIPLRPGGVLQTIMFIASQFSPSLGQEAQSQASMGPHFTVQAIMQLSRLLSSVPQDVEPVIYFTTIAPQLLELLDGDDPDLRKTAAYVIGSGILGKRAYGAPGAIGHSIFVEPLFKALTAELDSNSRQWMTPFSNQIPATASKTEAALSGDTLVNQAQVHLAIDRLRSLALQHPNPGLVKRIVYPILLPLWGLACYSQENQLVSFHDQVKGLLQTYFSISVGVQPLKKLVDNLLWDGGATWSYTQDAMGDICLKKHDNKNVDYSNLVQLIDSLEGRTQLFLSLLGSDPNSEERTGDIFLYVSEVWLVRGQGHDRDLGEDEDIVRKLACAKISEKLLHNFKDTLSRRPLRVLEVIKQVIDGELRKITSQRPRRQGQETETVSLSSLATIIPKEEDSDEKATTDKSSFESLSTAFSLLSTVLASAEFYASQATQTLLELIKNQLDRLIPLLPPALAKPGTTSSMLLEIQLTSPELDKTKPAPPHVADLETHRQALANLNSDLPPVQAEGFSLLSTLISRSSPVLDIPSTLALLLSIITDSSESGANEEFIYLNAIKTIGTLASRHPRTVIKTLVDSYADKSEERTLDQRLKIGESLLRTVQELRDALTGETVKILGEGMIAVAGRRGHKPQAQRSRAQQLEKARREKQREERKQKEPVMPGGWSIHTAARTSNLEADIGDEYDPEESESPQQTSHAANIVAAWAAGAATDENPDDLRVRTSALSILASAIQRNIISLGPAIVSSAVELCQATLTLEPGPESAILRRASAVLLLDILKALDTAREARGGQDIGFGFSLTDDSSPGLATAAFQNTSASSPSTTIGNIPSMLRTLSFVESREDDGIVRGHLRVLMESLEAWLEKSLMWGINAQTGQGFGEGAEAGLQLGDRIAGLSVNPIAARSGSGRPRIEEIE